MKKIFFISLFLCLSACNGQVIEQTKVIEVPKLDATLPDPLVFNSMTWHVYNSSELQALSNQQKNLILFTLTPDQMTILGSNIAEMQRYINESKQAIIFYRQQNADSNSISSSK